jgi:hypothetical protein
MAEIRRVYIVRMATTIHMYFTPRTSGTAGMDENLVHVRYLNQLQAKRHRKLTGPSRRRATHMGVILG